MIKYIFVLLIVFSDLSAKEVKPYVTAHLMGQFGNQMFIIAAATSLALDNDARPIFPTLATDTDFNIPINYEKVFHHLDISLPDQPFSRFYREPHFYYESIPYQPNMCIFGWFQSEKYFFKHKNEIIDLFSPNNEIMEYLETKYNDIIHNPKTVAIHFRSYAIEDPENKVYAECTLEYYKKAISIFPDDSVFIVFSNDMERCKQYFASLQNHFIYIDNETHYHDFYLMSLCKHHIICNSSFSWWAAYLNKNPTKIVIAPKKWFNAQYGANDKDLIPECWWKM